MRLSHGLSMTVLFDEGHVLALAALASSVGGQDPVDGAIGAAAAGKPITDGPELLTFIPFDPADKRAEATVRQADGSVMRIVKGAFATIQAVARCPSDAATTVDALQGQGYRVLAVATGPQAALQLIGLIALSDPPRDDSAALVAELAGLGVRTVMVTGDSAITANVVAKSIGILGPVWSMSPIPDDMQAQHFAVFAGVLPEDKFSLVKGLQKSQHIVGMGSSNTCSAPSKS